MNDCEGDWREGRRRKGHKLEEGRGGRVINGHRRLYKIHENSESIKLTQILTLTLAITETGSHTEYVKVTFVKLTRTLTLTLSLNPKLTLTDTGHTEYMEVESLKLTLTLTLTLTLSVNPKLTLTLTYTGGHTEYMKVASLKLISDPNVNPNPKS